MSKNKGNHINKYIISGLCVIFFLGFFFYITKFVIYRLNDKIEFSEDGLIYNDNEYIENEFLSKNCSCDDELTYIGHSGGFISGTIEFYVSVNDLEQNFIFGKSYQTIVSVYVKSDFQIENSDCAIKSVNLFGYKKISADGIKESGNLEEEVLEFDSTYKVYLTDMFITHQNEIDIDKDRIVFNLKILIRDISPAIYINTYKLYLIDTQLVVKNVYDSSLYIIDELYNKFFISACETMLKNES